MLHTFAFGQTIDFKAIILDEDSQEPLIGATLEFEELGKGSVTDIDGVVLVPNLPIGTYDIHVSYIGYEELETTISITANMETPIFYLHSSSEELEEVVVSTTRSTRTIQNIPTRIETIGLEELGEKAIMNSANISLVLRESTGIQIQQSSLSSGNSSIRIQGLDGRYTQLLKDGFPLYGGFANGLSIMQIPPLDLNQFEIIKGSSSTLYGGGAIAGLVNMVSKTPDKETPMLDIMLTQTQALGSTANVFYGDRKGKIGYTLYGSAHRQQAYDPDGDDFTNLPQTTAFSFNPKLFYYPSEQTTFWFGVNGTYDDRIGGDLTLIEEGANGIHQYFEENTSIRVNTQAVLEHQIADNKALQIKNSVAYFDRTLTTPNLSFLGNQWNSFTELNYSIKNEQSDWIFGANVYTNDFQEQETTLPRDQRDVTVGAFGNNITDLSERLILESGFRLDYADGWGVFPLPRMSLLWKANDRFSTRLGGGLGYKIPDLFTEEAAMLNFEGIAPIDNNRLNAERSYGLNLDLNYKTIIKDQLTFSINQLFYLTSIDNSLLLNSRNDGLFEFTNANGNILSQGAETNIKFTYKDFRWFINYAFIDVTLDYLPNNPQKPRTPRHNAGTVLMYENEDWRIGYEAYYTGSQLLTTGETTQDFVMMGLLIQKHFEWGSPFINFENFTDQRQSQFSSEVFPPHRNPIFAEIYAPTDGFIFSMGVVIKPFGEGHGH
jgi:iron complex outermembrane receptor protein